jgi:hypothetical protein
MELARLRKNALAQVPDHIPKPDWYATGEPTAEIETRQQKSGGPGRAAAAAPQLHVLPAGMLRA